jgi:hypothetical protein
MRDDLLGAHTNTAVRDAQGAGFGVDGDPDVEIGIVGEQLRRGQGLEAQLVVCVGSVRDQLTQEDFPVAVKLMHHQVQQLLDLGLKTESRGLFLSHHPSARVSQAPRQDGDS